MYNQNSKVSRRARNVPLEWGEWWGSIIDSMTTRLTEKNGIARAAYGEQIAETNNKVFNAECILCSVCGNRKHYLEFDRDSRYQWRFCRQHCCKLCDKRKRLDPVARRNKRISRSKQPRSA